jgi:hypothetical protein
MKFVQFTPSDARASRLGVRAFKSPEYAVAWARHSSVKKKTTFGRLAGVSSPNAAGAHPSVAAASAPVMFLTNSRLCIINPLMEIQSVRSLQVLTASVATMGKF